MSKRRNTKTNGSSMNMKTFLETYLEKIDLNNDKVLVEIPQDLVSKLYNLGIPKTEIEGRIINLITNAIEGNQIQPDDIEDVIEEPCDDDLEFGEYDVIEEPWDDDLEIGEYDDYPENDPENAFITTTINQETPDMTEFDDTAYDDTEDYETDDSVI